MEMFHPPEGDLDVVAVVLVMVNVGNAWPYIRHTAKTT